ncbi:phosphoenolpyruvate--protein phosphotransferase [Orrella daihaiensis]|uniref:Phosphoenolpyruvate-protein phosphotransferase n=1 Tax=Orrella daihaiensis TaxID=2782176 RepID=A0ABY4AMV4_9BURK|nr:phosphoenolpyruvate--protein phosphotransferase [Orrella daihaiensis]UOD51617.1 phosphoenolpyruvate--protein phosphotransferase [Orrella daihaiensis]
MASGYAMGRAVVLGAAALEVEHYRVAPESVEQETERLQRALKVTHEELTELASTLPADAPRELAAILSVHQLLLEDPLLAEESLALIRERQYNAEWALTTQGQLLGEQFSAMDDEYLRERGADVRQVVERVLHTLRGTKVISALEGVSDSGDPLIVVAHDIAPADMIRLRGARFAGFVTDLGGPTSHTAIVARSMGVPAVVALGNVRQVARDGDYLILDGQSGAVLINPTPAQIASYQALANQYADSRRALLSIKDIACQTLDGVRIGLQANIELPDEVGLALSQGAEGIGLFRSEFLFMGRENLPSEEEQFHAYQSVVQQMGNRPVTIRTLDIGADKSLDGEATVATNPALGQRAIRYCLARPELFAAQLRAILRASAFGSVRVLIPMITSLAEVRATYEMIESVKRSLSAQGIAFDPTVPIGAMVEVPAMAIAIEPFADAFDFLSIGTNDLIQYTLGIDRADSEVSPLYDPLHPAVLRLIAGTINAGERFRKPVSVCGEMAGDANLTRLLLGMGLQQFSMHPRQLLDVKQQILRAHSNALRTKVAAALNRAQSIHPDDLN